MSIEDRLYALVTQARQQMGEGVLSAPAQLVPRLSSQAPDLHAEIRALASALGANAGARIAGAADQTAETAKIANEIASGERLSIGPVMAALAVAQRIGPVAAHTMPPTPSGGWAGDSVVAGIPPPPPPHQPWPSAPMPAPAPTANDEVGNDAAPSEPIWKSKWAVGAAGALALFLFYQSSQRSQEVPTVPVQPGQPLQPGQAPGQAPGQTPGQLPGQPPLAPGQAPMPPGMAPGQPGQPPRPMAGPGQQPAPGGGGAAPVLQPPGGSLPALSVQRAQDGSYALFFQVQTRTGAAPGVIMLPAAGWDAGPSNFGFMRPGGGGNQLDTMGAGMFQRLNSPQGPVRAAQPMWQQDNVGLGNICIAFVGQGGQGNQDVPLQGSTMCVMDASCGQAAGCGRVQ